MTEQTDLAGKSNPHKWLKRLGRSEVSVGHKSPGPSLHRSPGAERPSLHRSPGAARPSLHRSPGAARPITSTRSPGAARPSLHRSPGAARPSPPSIAWSSEAITPSIALEQRGVEERERLDDEDER